MPYLIELFLYLIFSWCQVWLVPTGLPLIKKKFLFNNIPPLKYLKEV